MSEPDTQPVPQPTAFDLYVEALCEGWIADMTQEEIGKEFGVTGRQVRNWNKKVDWAHVRAEQKKHRDRKAYKVDNALYRKALTGDTKAIELWKQIEDEFVPTTAQKQTIRDERTDVDAKLNEYEEKIRESLTRPDAGTDKGLPPPQGDPGVQGRA